MTHFINIFIVVCGKRKDELLDVSMKMGLRAWTYYMHDQKWELHVDSFGTLVKLDVKSPAPVIALILSIFQTGRQQRCCMAEIGRATEPNQENSAQTERITLYISLGYSAIKFAFRILLHP